MARAHIPEYYYQSFGGSYVRIVNAQSGPTDSPEGGETQPINGLNGEVIAVYQDPVGLTVWNLDVTESEADEIDWRAEREATKLGNLGRMMKVVGTRREIYPDAMVQPLGGEPSEGARSHAIKVVIKTQPGVQA